MYELTVFTCVTGGFDNLDKVINAKPKVSPGVRFVAFCDSVKPRTVDGPTAKWEIRSPIWKHANNNRRTARFHKVLSHCIFPDTQYSMWIDGSQEFKDDVDPFAVAKEVLADNDVASFKHPQRNCVYQELEACAQLAKDDTQVMRDQISRYQFEGYPPLNGLVETACVCRRHTEPVRRFNDMWWHEIEKGSQRDQLSFNYVAWKLDIDYGYIHGHRSNSPYFVFHPHK